MMLSRLLVGDDGSPSAAAARTWAGHFADAAGAEVVVASVDSPSVGEAVGQAKPAGARQLIGSPATALLAFADEIAAELVVVGRRGAGGFEALRLGSTAHQVAEHATRPVAVVPAPWPRPRGAWPFASIAVGLDGSPDGAAALSWAVPLAAASSAAVLVVHALELGPVFMAAGLIDAYAQARARTTAAVNEWCEPLRDAGLAYTTALEEGGPAGVLLDAVRTHDADLLIVGRRTSGQFPGMAMGSAAHRALGFSPCPTVVVPATA